MEEFMAEIPEPSSGEVKSLAPAMSFTNEEGDRSKTEESNRFVAINIEALSVLSGSNDSTPSPRVSMMKNLARKGSQRSGGGLERKAAEGETGDSSLGGPVGDEKGDALLHVAGEGESSGLIHTSTPTAAGGRSRRRGRRQTPWLDPRRVLLVFASVSSMGTLLLLYFTLSMGKTAGGDTDAR